MAMVAVSAENGRVSPDEIASQFYVLWRDDDRRSSAIAAGLARVASHFAGWEETAAAWARVLVDP